MKGQEELLPGRGGGSGRCRAEGSPATADGAPGAISLAPDAGGTGARLLLDSVLSTLSFLNTRNLKGTLSLWSIPNCTEKCRKAQQLVEGVHTYNVSQTRELTYVTEHESTHSHI